MMPGEWWLHNRGIQCALVIREDGTASALPVCTAASRGEQPCEYDEGTHCPCLARHARIRDIATLIAQTQRSPDFPEPCSTWATRCSPTVFYHLPIFVHVCPVCGARENSYSRGMYGEPALDGDGTWYRAVEDVPDELRWKIGAVLRTVYLCSAPCMNAWEESRKR